MRKFVLLLIVLFFGKSYASEKIKIFKPAQDILWGIKKLAITEFKNQADQNIESLLLERLKQTKYFHVLSSQEIKATLAEKKLASDSLSQLADVLRILEIDGIVSGEIKAYHVEPDEHGTEKIKKAIWTGEYERDQFGKIIEENINGQPVKKKKFEEKLVEQKYRIRKGVVHVIFNVIAGKSGKRILTSSITKNYNSGKVPEEEVKSLPSADLILKNLSVEAVNELLKQISPKLIQVKREIESGEGFIDEGKAYALSNLWTAAIETWLKAEAMFPNNSAVYYNLGLAYEAQGEYEKAEIYYKKAYLLKGKKLYQKAIDNLRKGREKKEKLLSK